MPDDQARVERITFKFRAAHVGLSEHDTARVIADLKRAGDEASLAAADALEAAILSHEAVSDRLGVIEADAIWRVVDHIVEGGGSPSHQLVRLRDALREEYGDALEYEGTPAAE
jgi:hypothetical protein